ncbi:hypothetical protein [Kosmotoga olearia]|uniref:hypothetical protein n=1 Tax=Kosmotoga olearia TaxID=651457 RepID=UPI0001849534|nr:hypothetical protein [Kosmotoga olearia]
MMESSIRRALSDADIRPLIEFINKSNFSKGLNYLSPFVYKQVFNDLYIREKFFNYSIYVYSEFVDGKIHKVSYYQLPSPGSFSKSADLVLFASRNRPSKAEEFLVDSIHNLSQAHPVISKVKVNLKIEKNVTGVCGQIKLTPQGHRKLTRYPLEKKTFLSEIIETICSRRYTRGEKRVRGQRDSTALSGIWFYS